MGTGFRRCDEKKRWLSPILGIPRYCRAEQRLQPALVSDVEHLMPSSRRVAGEGEPGGLVEEGDAERGRLCRL